MTRIFINSIITILFLVLNQSIFAQSVADSLRGTLTKTVDTLKVNTLNELADIVARSDLKEAKDYAEQALKLAEELNFARGKARALNNLGQVAQHVGSYEKAIEFYTEAVQMNKEYNWDEIAKNLSNLANTYVEMEKYSKASIYAQQSLEAARDTSEMIFGLLAVGLIFNKEGNYPESLDYYLKAFELSKRFEYEHCQVLLHLGYSNMHLGDYDQAEKFNLEALQIAQKRNDRISELEAMATLSWFYNTQKEYEQSIKLLMAALKINETLRSESERVRILRGIGQFYMKLEKYEKAEEYFLKAISLSKENRLFSKQIASHIQLGTLYNKMDRMDESERTLLEGLRIYKEESENMHLERDCLLALELTS